MTIKIANKSIWDGLGNEHKVFDDYEVPLFMALEAMPTLKEGEKAIIRESKWVVYDPNVLVDVWLKTDSAVKSSIGTLDAVPDEYTTIAPADKFSTFNGKKWVIDEAKRMAQVLLDAENQYTSMMGSIDAELVPLSDAVELEMATDEEAARYKALRKYRVLLSRVKSQEGWPSAIEWPEVAL